MGSYSEKIQIIIDAVTNTAKSGIDALKGSTDEAAGSTGGLTSKVGGLGSSMLGAITSGAGLIAGAGALTGVIVKSVTAFESNALAVGKFSDATGVAVPDASRLYEVMQNLGIAPDVAEAAIGRLNREAQNSPQIFEDLGIKIAYAGDGTVDAAGTWTNAVDVLNGVKDPAKQAADGFELFGKGWQGMATIVGDGAPKLKDELASVQPSHIFTDGDVNTAKSMRDGFKDIENAASGLMLTVGKSLAPVIAAVAPELGKIIEAAAPLAKMLGDQLGNAFKVLKPAIDLVADAMPYLVKGIELLELPVTIVTDALGKLADAWDSITGKDPKPIGAIGDQLQKNLDAAKAAGMTLGEYDDAQAKLKASTESATISQASMEDQLKLTAVVTKDQTADLNAHVKALQDDLKAETALITAQRDAADSGANVTDKTVAFKDSVAGLTDKLTAAAGDVDRVKQAYDQNTQSAADLADAIVKQRTEQDAANGITTSAKDKADAWNGSMLNAASTLQGPARQSVLDYIDNVNAIPPEKATAIKAAIDAGDLDTANQLLADASATRAASIHVDVDQNSIAAANAQIQKSMNQSVIVNVRTAQTGSGPQQGAHASGGTVGPNEVESLIDEQGPEILTLPGGTQVMTAAATKRALAAGGNGGGNTFVTVNAPNSMSAAQLAAEIRRYNRRNGTS